jgi:hypothetical protein
MKEMNGQTNMQKVIMQDIPKRLEKDVFALED